MRSTPDATDPIALRTSRWSHRVRSALIRELTPEIAAHVWVTGSLGRDEAVPGSDIESLAISSDTRSAQKIHYAVAATDLSGAPNFAPSSLACAADPRLVRSPEMWEIAAAEWATRPAATLGIVQLGLLADARPVMGDGEDHYFPLLAARAVANHPRILADFLADALAKRASLPSNFPTPFRSDPVVDLKNTALTPIVKLARWAALRSGVTTRSTLGRLQEAEDRSIFTAEQWASLRTAATVTAEIRWEVRRRANPAGPGSDRVPLSMLAGTERAALREATRITAGAQRTVDYLRSSGELRDMR